MAATPTAPAAMGEIEATADAGEATAVIEAQEAANLLLPCLQPRPTPPVDTRKRNHNRLVPQHANHVHHNTDVALQRTAISHELTSGPNVEGNREVTL